MSERSKTTEAGRRSSYPRTICARTGSYEPHDQDPKAPTWPLFPGSTMRGPSRTQTETKLRNISSVSRTRAPVARACATSSAQRSIRPRITGIRSTFPGPAAGIQYSPPKRLRLGLTGRKKLGNDWFLVVEVVEAEPLHWFAYPILIAHKRVWRDTSQYRQVFWFCLFAGNGFRYGAGSTRRPVHAGVRPERLG
jgi:hypothetical protein